MLRLIEKLRRKRHYAKTWGTPIGRDCIDLNTTLCRWLGLRLLHLSENTQSEPTCFTHEQWIDALEKAGDALMFYVDHHNEPLVDTVLCVRETQEALRWVADHIEALWD